MISATIRDIAIIVIAFQSILIFVLLAVLAWQVWRLVKMLEVEIKPILDDTKETVNTVRGTTVFLSDNLVEPVVQSNRRVTRWRRTAQALVRDLRGQPAPPKPRPTSPPVPPPATPTPTTATPTMSSPETPPPIGSETR